MSYLQINSLENYKKIDILDNNNDILENNNDIISRIDNLENKMDTILLAINSLIKYNSKIDENINYIINKININNDDALLLSRIHNRNNIDLGFIKKDILNEHNNVKFDEKINQINDETKEIKKESKLNNYRSLMSNNIKLNKSPARFKNRSTERTRSKSENTVSGNTESKNISIVKNNKEQLLEVNIEKKLNIDKLTENITEKNNNKNTISESENECTVKLPLDSLEKKKKCVKSIDKYKDIKKEIFNIDTNFIKKCLNDTCIESDIKVFKKMYIEDVSKEYYPIRNFRKKLQYWLDGHMNDDIDGNYIKDTVIHNIETCYININKYDDYQDNTEQFIRNQEYITKMNDQKYKDKFLSMIFSIIKI
jgi:hypothetical protein